MATNFGRPTACYYCNQEGHIKRNCPKKVGNHGVGTNKSEFLCYLCNQPGHIKRNCPKLSAPSPKYKAAFEKPAQEIASDSTGSTNSQFFCYHCDQAGHVKKNCPELSKSSSGHKIISKNPIEVKESPTANFAVADVAWPSLTQQQAQVKLKPNPASKSSYTDDKDKPSVSSKAACSGVATRVSKLSSGNGDGLIVRSPIVSEQKEVDQKTDQSNESDCKGLCDDHQSLPADNLIASVVENERTQNHKISNLPFVDTHCHLEYVFERYKHTGSFMDFMRKWKYPRDFDGCIASFCDPAAFSSFGIWSDLLSEPDSKVWAAFGIHPHNARYYFTTPGLEENLLKCMEHERCVAFGEIGLDYGKHCPSDTQTQKTVFAHQLQLGVALGKPLVLHCRDAEDDMFEILSKHAPLNWKIHFHCFTGKLDKALKFLTRFPHSFLGVCGNVTFNAQNVVTVAREVPLDRLLIETDAPYNIPRNFPRTGRCRHSHPAHAHYIG